MTSLGLALCQRRSGLIRLALIGVASALATFLLLLATATWQASGRQAARTDRLLRPFPIPWVQEPGGGRSYTPISGETIAGPRTIYRVTLGTLAGRELKTVRLAKVGAGAPVPPGITRLPDTGEVFLSPALARLTGNDSSLLPRGVRSIGVISSDVLAAPDDLVEMLGVAVPTPRVDSSYWTTLTTFSPPSGTPSDGNGLYLATPTKSRLGVVTIATGLLIALLAFVASAGQFALASRERRFASMALAGATPRQVRAVAAWESGVAAAAGSFVGLAAAAGLLWLRGRHVSLFGYSAFRQDLELPSWLVVTTMVGIAALSAAAAALGARRSARRPLDVRRGTRPRRFSERLPGIGVAVLILGLFLTVAAVTVVGAFIGASIYLVGVVLSYAAVSMIATALTLRIAERLRDGRRPAGMVAGSRITSGYGRLCGTFVLAAFALVPATIAVVVDSSGAPMPRHADGRRSDLALWEPGGESRNSGLADAVRRIPGVVAAVAIRRVPGVPDNTSYFPPREAETANCADLAAARASTVAFACPNGAVSGSARGEHRGQAVSLPIRGRVGSVVVPIARVARSGWVDDASIFVPPALLPRNTPRGEVLRVELRTDGTAATARRVTLAAQAAVSGGVAVRALAVDPATSGWTWRGRGLVFLAALLVLAAASLALVTVEGMIERRRAFATLAAQGAPPTTLSRAAALEVAVPGVAAIVTGVLIGLAIGVPITTARDHVSFALPEVGAILGVALCATLFAAGAVAFATRRWSDIGALRGST